ncbi:T-complex protein 1 subunit eta [Thalictrum thalictroides]|uniref:T-complex protein 1 subunit eta n=1 Tax=Thalictrum thalictroides TaxID=46969 RepID=A0A7J6X6D6_THATH|nr:T-complex protein 1 subunit eta [Thalictrum thalictroides]
MLTRVIMQFKQSGEAYIYDLGSTHGSSVNKKEYFADRDIFCVGHVTEEDLQQVAAATGGTIHTSVNNVIDEERQVGNERFNIFSGCLSGQTATIVLRGGVDQGAVAVIARNTEGNVLSGGTKRIQTSDIEEARFK